MEGTGRMLPSSRLVLLLAAPLEQDVEYGVRVSSVVNINGLEGGGGEGTFVLEPPVPDTVAVDTMAVPPIDTLGAASGESPTRPPREAPLGSQFPGDFVPAYAPEAAFQPARGSRR
jgi:hypothetical protein